MPEDKYMRRIATTHQVETFMLSGKSNENSFMETIVWWSEGGGSLNKEASWRPLSGGEQGGGKFK